jgi:hypothetical protein
MILIKKKLFKRHQDKVLTEQKNTNKRKTWAHGFDIFF